MALLTITDTIKTPVNEMIWQLFHDGRVVIAGREIRLGVRQLPVPSVVGDAVVWRFPQPVRVSTPGPDSSVSEIKQYRDRIEFSVWPWAEIRIETK